MDHDAGGDERAHLFAVMHALQRTVEDPGAPGRIAEDARGWLDALGVPAQDAAAWLLAGEKRMLIYRKLVRRGLTGAVRIQIPRTAARLEASWDVYMERYLSDALPRSHYLRDVAFEFVDWALPRWAVDSTVPPYIGDLARHELFAFEVATAPDCRAGRAGQPLALDRAVRFDPSARLKRYAWAIHRLSADETARDTPPREPTMLLGYRDAEHEVRYLELTDLAAAILERLIGGRVLGEAVVEASGGPPSQQVLQNVARLLADLGDRGVTLGAD